MALTDHLPKVTQRIRPNLTKGIDDLTLDHSQRLAEYRRAMLEREAQRRPMEEITEAFRRAAENMSHLYGQSRQD